MIITTAGAGAVSTGRPVEAAGPETSYQYEAGVGYHSHRFSTDASFFVNTVYDNIVYQALILPQGAIGTTLGDQPITAQGATGVVYVPAASSPVLVRTNYGDARIRGFEHRMDLRLTSTLSAGTVLTLLHAHDLSTGLAPNIEGGTPGPDFYLKVRYAHPSGRYWVEPVLHVVGQQDRLSSLDLEDRRTGATRTRSNIKNFFYNGATVRGWVTPGADGIAGNKDDILTLTGETLAQVQGRVLGTADSAPLYTSVAGYTTVAIRGGLRLARTHELLFEAENITDKNYRGIAWGIDAPGAGFSVAYVARFKRHRLDARRAGVRPFAPALLSLPDKRHGSAWPGRWSSRRARGSRSAASVRNARIRSVHDPEGHDDHHDAHDGEHDVGVAFHVLLQRHDRPVMFPSDGLLVTFR
jgi:hemoglobin/transferrin/lactoferrin receptor protein